MTTRVDPVRPPYPAHVAERLDAMMPPGVPPILLFRTFARNLPMTAAISGWGGYELSKRLSLSMRDREIIIDRTCARCRCEYEWGVHVAFFAERVGLSGQQITSLTHGSAWDPCWTGERDRLLIEAADALHDSADIGDDLWHRLARLFSDEQLLDLLMLAGWYHAISFTANGARVACEDGAPRFADVLEVFGNHCQAPIDDPEDAGVVAVVTAAVAGPGVRSPLRDGVLAVSNDPVDVLHDGRRRVEAAEYLGEEPVHDPLGTGPLPGSRKAAAQGPGGIGARVALRASMSPALRSRTRDIRQLADVVHAEICGAWSMTITQAFTARRSLAASTRSVRAHGWAQIRGGPAVASYRYDR